MVVGARVLVAVDAARAVLAVGDLDGDDLLGERAALVRVDRPLVGAQGELVLLLARDRVLAAEVLGRLDHPARHRVVGAAGGDAAADQAVLEHRAAGAGAPAQRGRVELGLAHALGAAGQHEVGGPGLHLHRRVDHRLQPGAAAAVDLQARAPRPAARRRARPRGRAPAPRRWRSPGRAGRRRRPRAGSSVRSISALITVVARSVTGTSRNMPPKRPTGVRSGSQMRASRMRAQLSWRGPGGPRPIGP